MVHPWHRRSDQWAPTWMARSHALGTLSSSVRITHSGLSWGVACTFWISSLWLCGGNNTHQNLHVLRKQGMHSIDLVRRDVDGFQLHRRIKKLVCMKIRFRCFHTGDYQSFTVPMARSPSMNQLVTTSIASIILEGGRIYDSRNRRCTFYLFVNRHLWMSV